MYGCENWTIKKAEHRRIDAFKLWCWRIFLRVPWTARGSNQSILKEINPEYSLKGLMLKLKLQYFGHLMWRANSLGKTLMLGKIEGRRRKGWQMMRWLGGIFDSMDMSSNKLQETVKDGKPCVLPSMGSQTVGYDWTTEQQQMSPLSSVLNTKISDVIHWESLNTKLSLLFTWILLFSCSKVYKCLTLYYMTSSSFSILISQSANFLLCLEKFHLLGEMIDNISH